MELNQITSLKKLKIVIMGGTFNPPHLAHLICAEEVYDTLKFDKVIFIPSARPPHKNSNDIIDPHHRYMMTCLATKDNPHFEVSRIELDRPGRSYTIETVKEIKKIYKISFQDFFPVFSKIVLGVKIGLFSIEENVLKNLFKSILPGHLQMKFGGKISPFKRDIYRIKIIKDLLKGIENV